MMLDFTANAAHIFEQRGHYYDYPCRREVFVQQIEAHLRALPQATVLDIGCGRGMDMDVAPQRRLARIAGRFWGVEPDTSVAVDGCFDRVWRASLEDADIPAASIDVAYSYMVLEHVLEPNVFLQRLADVLRPGGVFLGLTINRASYLARIARLCERLKIQDIVLRLVRGAEMVDEYHYPAVYRMNSELALQQAASRLGLDEPEVTFLERGEWHVYFPRPFRWIGRCATHAIQRSPARFTHLLVRLRKPRAEAATPISA